MARIVDTRAVVLTTQDVGEADRFATLLTEDVGRLTVRACGVRRTASRLMGGVLSLQLVAVRLEPTRRGWVLTAVRVLDAFPGLRASPSCFAIAHRGVEVLLRLLKEEAPLPEVFRATCAFFRACAGVPPPLLFERFTCELFALLGMAERTERQGTSLKRQCETYLFDHGMETLVSERVGEALLDSTGRVATPICS